MARAWVGSSAVDPSSSYRLRRVSSAAKYGVTEAQLLLRWGVQNGYPVLPKTTNPACMRQNADIFSFAVDERDMAELATLDRGDGVAWAIGDPTKAA